MEQKIISTMKDLDATNQSNILIKNLYYSIRALFIQSFGERKRFVVQYFTTEKYFYLEGTLICEHEHILSDYALFGDTFFLATNEYRFSAQQTEKKSTNFDRMKSQCEGEIKGVFEKTIEIESDNTYYLDLMDFAEMVVQYTHLNIRDIKQSRNFLKIVRITELIKKSFLLYNAILEIDASFKDCVPFANIEYLSKEYFVFYTPNSFYPAEMQQPNNLLNKINIEIQNYVYQCDNRLAYLDIEANVSKVRATSLHCFIFGNNGLKVSVGNEILPIDNILKVIPMQILMPFKDSINKYIELICEYMPKIIEMERELENQKLNYLHQIELL